MKERQRVVLCWHRFGPYHHARASAAAGSLAVIGLEVSTVDRINAWARVERSSDFELVTLFQGIDEACVSADQLCRRIELVLAKLAPSVLVVHGYGSRDALAILDWAVRQGCPAVLMSASNSFDQQRKMWREWVKSRLARLFSAGLVGGSSGREYLTQLGFERKLVFDGYDIVDNNHFAVRSVGKKCSDSEFLHPFFMTLARFIEKENLFRLLDAYLLYRQKCPEAAWRLVIVGDGPLKPQLEAYRDDLGLKGCVRFPGYKQYEELPAWYSSCSCFILPSVTEQWGLVVNEAMAAGLPVLVSNRCGCARDLVKDGVNGFIFDPYNTEALADVMYCIAHGGVDREAMGRNSQAIIAKWGPDRFSDGLQQAVAAALAAPPVRPTVLDKALLWALIHR